MSEFHFLRPLWLLALPAVAALVIGVLRAKHSSRNWAAVCDAQLLPFMLVDARGLQRRTLAPWLVGITGSLLVWALAGPTWERLPHCGSRVDVVEQGDDGFFVGYGDVGAAKAESGQPTHGRRQLIWLNGQRQVDQIEPQMGGRRIVHGRAEAVSYGPADDTDQPGLAANFKCHFSSLEWDADLQGYKDRRLHENSIWFGSL